mgnify:CR=1 FL=1
MTILLTGGLGFIGSNLMELLLKLKFGLLEQELQSYLKLKI